MAGSRRKRLVLGSEKVSAAEIRDDWSNRGPWAQSTFKLAPLSPAQVVRASFQLNHFSAITSVEVPGW